MTAKRTPKKHPKQHPKPTQPHQHPPSLLPPTHNKHTPTPHQATGKEGNQRNTATKMGKNQTKYKKQPKTPHKGSKNTHIKHIHNPPKPRAGTQTQKKHNRDPKRDKQHSNRHQNKKGQIQEHQQKNTHKKGKQVDQENKQRIQSHVC